MASYADRLLEEARPKLDTGGFAFPTMTLLDYFAGQAMIGELSGAKHTQPAEVLAKRSWEFAQQMLAEKKRLEGLQ